MRQHFCHVYAYCRWSDDLADETAGGEESLRLLDWWQSQLNDCYRGAATHPVFVALGSTIREFDIPKKPFADLLVAFRQDQTQTRYETFDDLLGYCRNSADPVGRLVLYLGGCHDDLRGRLADFICTGLQLANFWQDVARDFDRGRIYLPQESCRQFGYDEAMFKRQEFNPQFRQLLASEVARAETFFDHGEPLVDLVPRELRIDVQLFIEGGRAILDAIRRSRLQRLALAACGQSLDEAAAVVASLAEERPPSLRTLLRRGGSATRGRGRKTGMSNLDAAYRDCAPAGSPCRLELLFRVLLVAAREAAGDVSAVCLFAARG